MQQILIYCSTKQHFWRKVFEESFAINSFPLSDITLLPFSCLKKSETLEKF